MKILKSLSVLMGILLLAACEQPAPPASVPQDGSEITIVKVDVIYLEEILTRTSAELGTPFEEILMFKNTSQPGVVARLTLSDGYTLNRPVRWHKGDYNENHKGTYIIKGDLDLSYLIVKNPDNLQAEILLRIIDVKEELARLTGTWELTYTREDENSQEVTYTETYSIENPYTRNDREYINGFALSRSPDLNDSFSEAGKMELSYSFFYDALQGGVMSFGGPYDRDHNGSYFYLRVEDNNSVTGTHCPSHTTGVILHNAKVSMTGRKTGPPRFWPLTQLNPLSPSSVTVPVGTEFADIPGLPEGLHGTVRKASTNYMYYYKLLWNTENYDPGTPGVYTIEVTADLEQKFTSNPNNIKHSFTITVE